MDETYTVLAVLDGDDGPEISLTDVTEVIRDRYNRIRERDYNLKCVTFPTPVPDEDLLSVRHKMEELVNGHTLVHNQPGSVEKLLADFNLKPDSIMDIGQPELLEMNQRLDVSIIQWMANTIEKERASKSWKPVRLVLYFLVGVLIASLWV